MINCKFRIFKMLYRKKIEFRKNNLWKNNQRILNEHRECIIGLLKERNYQNSYPCPETISEHRENFPKSFYIQILGARGAGKSTFINQILRRLNKQCVTSFPQRAKTGSEETTLLTEFFEITAAVQFLSSSYERVFLVDQPGIGGRKIREANYLQKFGPGSFPLWILLKSIV